MVVIPMPKATTRLAPLSAGQVNWIEVPPTDAIPSLESISPRWSPTGPIRAARIEDPARWAVIKLGSRHNRVRRPRYSAGTGSTSLGALPNAMIFERPDTAIAVSV
jgi:hypothetical protein